MKRLVSLFAVLLLIFTTTAGLAEYTDPEIDLSQFSFEGLRKLRSAAMWEMIRRDEWQEARIQMGVYEIGVDIPAGKWEISPIESAFIIYGNKLDATKNSIDTEDGDCMYRILDTGATVMTFEDGWFFEVTSGAVRLFKFYGNNFDLK